MTKIFGSKAPSQYALDSVRAARADQLATKTVQNWTKSRRSLPAAIRLDAGIANHWPARDQYGRGTCVAFATLAAVELHRAIREDMPPERLSEQFLHERMVSSHPLSQVEAADIPEGGVLLRQALSALEQDGVVKSAYAPYKPNTTRGGPRRELSPSFEALQMAAGNRIQCRAYGTIGAPDGVDPNRVDNFQPGQETAKKMLGFLQDGLPVAVGVPLFQHPSGLNNWVLPSTVFSGIVLCPEDADAPPLNGPRANGHVVCLTGFQPDASEPHGGWFVFRNSWGLGFASHSTNNPSGPTAGMRGYGLISASHINTYCWEYLVPVATDSGAAA